MSFLDQNKDISHRNLCFEQDLQDNRLKDVAGISKADTAIWLKPLAWKVM